MKNIKLYFLFVVVVFVIKFLINKFIGRFYSYSKALTWDDIYNELPISIVFSLIGGFLFYLAYREDKKDKERE